MTLQNCTPANDSAVRDLLRHDDGLVKLLAVWCLDEFGVYGDADIPILIGFLHDDFLLIRKTAANALAKLGPGSNAAISHLIELLQHDQPEIRRIAASTLGRISPEARLVIPALADMLAKEDDRCAAEAAANAIRMMGSPAIPVLTGFLKHEVGVVREAAVDALRRMRPEATCE